MANSSPIPPTAIDSNIWFQSSQDSATWKNGINSINPDGVHEQTRTFFVKYLERILNK